jgi:hypothetical protein
MIGAGERFRAFRAVPFQFRRLPQGRFKLSDYK